MKCTAMNFASFLGGSNQLRVPVWHRDYRWPDHLAMRLLEHVERAGSTDSEHFAGTITVVPPTEQPHSHHLLIVDGQQRLVTFTLIVLALAKVVRERNECGVLADDSGTAVATADNLIAKYVYLPQGGATTRRLQLRERDEAALAARISGTGSRDLNSCAFEEHLRSVGRLDNVYKGLLHMHGATVELSHSNGDPAEIFVQLNS